ncbi:MAG: hypothetical protein FWG53_04840, partial [Clostridiales bacterium]|nr:hypothetical protein [Clostridiales bacterium]
MNKRILSFLLLFMMLFTLAMPAYGADNAASVTTSMKGNDVTIAVKDGLAVVTTVVAYAKNTTQTYDVEGYKVTIEYNGSGVKKASITGYPSTSANAPAAAPASPAPSENTPAPKPGVSVSGANMTWNKADEAAAKAFTQSASKDTAVPLTALIPVNSKKTDASGDKIPSNAHSGDYPGIYFYWNDKQKDDGILKVDPALFDLFKDGKFYITAKNSNAYWDYWISPDDPKAAVTSEGYLLYQIPRYFMYSDKNNKITKDELKNINMIFIGGDYKDAFLIIEKDWFDEDGNLVVDKTLIGELNKKLSFDSNAGKLKLGLNTIKITDFSSAYFGKKLTVSEGAIAGYKTKLNPITLTVKYNDVPVKSITFENQKLWAFIKISKAWDLLPGSTAPGAKFNIYDMNDNLLYEGVGPGTYQVKEGTYKVAEIAISGFTADKESATITVDAGKTGTVSFKNKEDRATITPIKMWVGDELPAGVEAKLTNGYTFGETKTVKAGTNVAFEEEAIDFVIVDDFIYTFELESIALAKGSDAAQVVSVVDFTAEKDVAYTVYFSNKVTKKPLAADLTIVKVWQDENGEPLDKTGLFATVDSDIVFTAPYVLGLNEDVVHGLDLATIEEDIGACAYEDSEYWYTFEQVGVSGNDRIVGPGGSYTITFTNKLVKTPKPADLTIVKVWQDENGGLLGKTGVFATVDADIAFTAPYVLGLNSNVALGLDLATIAEDLSACAYEDSEYWYAFEQVGVSGNSGIVGPGGSYTVTFTNKLVKTPKPADLTIVKVWQDENGGALDKTGVFATVDADIAFTAPYVLGLNSNVALGLDLATIAENLGACAYEDSEYWYAFTQVGVAGNSGIVGPGGSYTVTFTNKLVKVPKPADLTIVKVWQDENGAPLDKTDVFATVDADITFTAPYVLGLNSNVALGLDLATIAENLGACAYEDSEYWYTFAQVGIAGNSGIVGPGGSYTVTFTNKLVKAPKPAKVTIVKNWLDENGEPLNKTGVFATVDADILFSDFNLGENLNIPAGQSYTVTENLANCAYEDSGYWYSFEQVGVNGNVFTTAPGGAHTVTFTNKLVKIPKPAKVTIVKNWLNENGGPLDKTGVFATVDADISFSAPFVLGVNNNVALGTSLAVTEDVTACAYEDTGYWYSFEQVAVTGNSGIVAAGGDYTVTFTNKLVKTPKPAKVTIVKIWQDENGGPLSKTGLFADVDVDISFTAPFVLGVNNDVALGTDLSNLVEDVTACAYQDAGYWYSFVQVAVSGNDGIVAAGGDYTVTFTNKLVKIPKPAKVTIV